LYRYIAESYANLMGGDEAAMADVVEEELQRLAAPPVGLLAPPPGAG
jgi:hypothetical protein